MSARLRESTRDLHEAAEKAVALPGSLIGSKTYVALLGVLRGFYSPVEDALTALTGWRGLTPAIDLSSRRRTFLLDRDLAELGGPVPPIAPGRSAVPPALGSLARGLGCLYVVEGSTLGGQVMARLTRAALGPDTPVAFFTGGDRNPGKNWQDLKRAIDTFAVSWTDLAAESAIAAARETFSIFGGWLDRGRTW